MARQPRYDALEPSRLFADGMSARQAVHGTVARGTELDGRFLTGRQNGEESDRRPPSLEEVEDYLEAFPIRLTPELLERGQERYGIYCAPCHDAQGTGRGTVVAHGFPPANSFHTERLRQAPAGYLFDVITQGRGKMPAYAEQITPGDRWAIVAYLRALQLSQHAQLDELPPEFQDRFATPDSEADR